MSEYMDYNTWLEVEVNRLETQCKYINRNYKLILDDKINLIMKEAEYKDKIRELKKENEKLHDEKTKLSNELTSKIRHNHIQTLEINELKRELKEYRGF